MRDAVVAALTLHIFQAHADRVQMANIAQTVNVLQAMILTEGEQMILTPSYHAFEMLKGHQDATLLPMETVFDAYSQDDQSLPVISASASRSASGEILLSLANLHPHTAQTIEVQIPDASLTSISGQVLAADALTAHNTFAQPERVRPAAFAGATLQDGQHIRIQLPPASVVALTMR
jgi:alpha-N-arabinofuranosidase